MIFFDKPYVLGWTVSLFSSLWRFIRSWATFSVSFLCRKSELSDNRFECLWRDRWPCLSDATSKTGFDAHYLYHTAWAARILAQSRPSRHVDIGSCLRFATLVSAFVPTDFYDYRPAVVSLSGLNCKQANLLHLPFGEASISSLSCMHVVEHVGLERYGDPFAPQGDLKAMKELQRVLAPSGRLLFVVPVGGKALIQYNAHRIYTFEMILSYFNELKLQTFSLVTDSGKFIEQATSEDAGNQMYGCGCFYLQKVNPAEKTANSN